MQHFNRLTPAQAERLAILAEECGEVIQVVGKILRHGYDSHHPVRNVDNVSMLEQELGDLGAAVFMLAEAKDIDHRLVERHITEKRERVKKYMHHLEKPRIFNKIDDSPPSATDVTAPTGERNDQ